MLLFLTTLSLSPSPPHPHTFCHIQCKYFCQFIYLSIHPSINQSIIRKLWISLCNFYLGNMPRKIFFLPWHYICPCKISPSVFMVFKKYLNIKTSRLDFTWGSASIHLLSTKIANYCGTSYWRLHPFLTYLNPSNLYIHLSLNSSLPLILKNTESFQRGKKPINHV